jgi:hypothetical protein
MTVRQLSMKLIGVGLFLGAGIFTWKMVTPLKVWGGDVKACTLESYQGRYVWAGGGKNSAVAGLEIYNGDGTMTGISSASDNGKIVEVSYTGTYTVNPDCTSTLTTTDENQEVTHFTQFLGPKGEEFTWIQTDPGSVSAGFERRVR